MKFYIPKFDITMLAQSVLFVMTSANQTQRVGFCAGREYLFGLETFNCSESYTLLNLTIHRPHGHCYHNDTFLWLGERLRGEECHNVFLELMLVKLKTEQLQCETTCTSDFRYKFGRDISKRSGCCPYGCSFAQMWLYFRCDVQATTEKKQELVCISETSPEPCRMRCIVLSVVVAILGLTVLVVCTRKSSCHPPRDRAVAPGDRPSDQTQSPVRPLEGSIPNEYFPMDDSASSLSVIIPVDSQAECTTSDHLAKEEIYENVDRSEADK